jgi:hypothetical protein
MRRWFVLVMMFALWLGVAAAQEVELTTITLPQLELDAGANVIYEITIDCLADGCSAFDIALSYDPALIRVDELEVGPYLGDDVFVVENKIDPEAGTLRLAAAALGDLPETGETVLVVMQITALGSGEASFTVDHLDVGDLIGNPVDVEVVEGGTAVLATPQAGPCVVVAQAANTVQVRVGPGVNRTAVTYLPAQTEFIVQGQTEDTGGTVWYQLDKEEAAPGKLVAEAWVSSEDVIASEGCDSVAEISAPPIIPIVQGRATPRPSTGGTSGIQHIEASSPSCQTIQTVNPNPFELGVSWETSHKQNGYYRANGTNRFRVASDPNSAHKTINVTLVVSTTTGDWVHTLNVTTSVC